MGSLAIFRQSASSFTVRRAAVRLLAPPRARPARRRLRRGAAPAFRPSIAPRSAATIADDERRAEPERAAINGHSSPLRHRPRAASIVRRHLERQRQRRVRVDAFGQRHVVDHEEVRRGLERVDEARGCRRSRRTASSATVRRSSDDLRDFSSVVPPLWNCTSCSRACCCSRSCRHRGAPPSHRPAAHPCRTSRDPSVARALPSRSASACLNSACAAAALPLGRVRALLVGRRPAATAAAPRRASTTTIDREHDAQRQQRRAMLAQHPRERNARRRR